MEPGQRAHCVGLSEDLLPVPEERLPVAWSSAQSRVAASSTYAPAVERRGLGAISVSSPITVLAMPDPDHDDHQVPVPDRVDDSIPADPSAIPIVLSTSFSYPGG